MEDFFKNKYLGAILALITLASGYSIIKNDGMEGFIVTLGAFALLIIVIVVYNYRKPSQIEIGEFQGNICQAKSEDIKEIVELDRKVFKPYDVIEESVFQDWYSANKKIFTVIKIDNKVRGYYAILPIKSKRMKAFIAGNICEEDFTSDDIVTVPYQKRVRQLYFFSMVTDFKYPKLKKKFIKHAVDSLIKAYYKTDGKLQAIYAAAATRQGANLIEKFDFNLICKSCNRKDDHDLYELKLEFEDFKEHLYDRLNYGLLEVRNP